MLAVAKITPQSIHDLCKMDPDAAINESKNKFMRNLIKKAHNFDNYSEKVLDQAMCTKTCPCYTERTEAPEDPDTPYVRNDTWHKYSELGQEQYNFHQRIFSQARKDNLKINTNWTIFEWSFDRENSFETFEECVDSWVNKKN